MLKTRLRLALAAMVAAAIAALTACGGSASTSSNDDENLSYPTVTVGVQPNSPFAVVPLGVQQGIFKKHHLNVKIKIITTATTIPPALLAGQLQFSNWSFASFATLADKGLPLKIVGPGDTTGTNLENDYIQLVSLKSGPASVSALAGKTIGVNSLASLSEVQIRIALKKAAVDPASVKLVPIPFSDQLAALKAGRVDAIGVAEPFLTQAKEDVPLNLLAPLDAGVMPDMPLSLWMTSGRFFAQHPDQVKQFQMGLKESLEYARNNPAAVRAFIPGFANVEPAVAQKMIMPTWVTSYDPAKVQEIAEIMHEYGIVRSTPDLTGYMVPFPLSEGK